MNIEASRTKAGAAKESAPPISEKQEQQLTVTYGEGAEEVGRIAQAALAEDARPQVADLEAIRRDKARTSEVFHDVQDETEHFERQFRKRHHFPFGKDTIEYQMAEPREANRISDEWVVFVGGFNSVARNYKYEIANLVQSGRRVLFVNPETPNTPIKRGQYQDSPGVAPLIRLEAEALGALLEYRGIHRADMVGHSRGGLVAAVLASERPELADSLVLDCPAGFSGGKETPIALVGRALEESESEKKQYSDADDSGGNFLKQISTNLWWKLLNEVPAVAESNIVPVLEKLRRAREEGKGDTNVTLVNAHGDKLFTPKLVESALMPNPGDDPFRLVDEWLSYAHKEAGHGKISRPHEGLLPTVLREDEELEPTLRRMIALLLQRKVQKAV
jgi:pimeloyl-ACP methyl ester carboxylesterase